MLPPYDQQRLAPSKWRQYIQGLRAVMGLSYLFPGDTPLLVDNMDAEDFHSSSCVKAIQLLLLLMIMPELQSISK